MYNIADRVHNAGYIVVANKNQRIRIQLKLSGSDMVLTVPRGAFHVKPLGQNYYVKRLTAQKYNEYKTLRQVIGFLAKTAAKSLLIIDGQFTIKDISFSLFLLTNGFMLKLDIEFWPQTFIIMDTETGIVVAHKEGIWDNPVVTQKNIMKQCKDYNEAMEAIYTYCKPNISTLLAVPHLIN